MKKIKVMMAAFTAAIIVCSTFFVTSAADMKTIEVGNGSLNLLIDGIPYSDTGSFLFNNRAYVPFRFIAEALGADVEWDPETFTIRVRQKLSASTSTQTSATTAETTTTTGTITTTSTTSTDVSTTTTTTSSSSGGYPSALPPNGNYFYDYGPYNPNGDPTMQDLQDKINDLKNTITDLEQQVEELS